MKKETTNSMKNILIITQNFPPESVGRASRIFRMAKFLVKFHDVTITCPPPTFPFSKFKRQSNLLKKEKFEDLNVIRIWTFQPQKSTLTFFERARYTLIFPIFFTFFFIKNSSKFSTIIFSTPPQTILFASYIARIFRKRIVIDVGDLQFNYASISSGLVKKNRWLGNKLNSFEINCWKKSDVIICNSLVVKDKLNAICTEKKIIYFPYNVDTEIFKKHNLKTLNQIVYLGSMGVKHNLESLIKALPLILKKIPDLKLQLYGGGEVEQKLKELVEKLHLQKNCIFNTPIPKEEIPLVLSKSLVGIDPIAMDDFLYYAIPTKTFEYLACGLPIFAYGRSDELDRVIKESGAGKFVRTDDPKKIAEKIIQMVNDKDALKDYSKNGIKFIEKTMNSTSLVEAI